MTKIEFVTSLVKSKLKIGGFREGLRDMIIAKHRPSPFTGIKNHFNIYLRSFSILIWSHGPLKHQFLEPNPKSGPSKNRGALALFQKKIVRALQFKSHWPIMMLLTWFFLHWKARICLFSHYMNIKISRSPHEAPWNIEIWISRLSKEISYFFSIIQIEVKYGC